MATFVAETYLSRAAEGEPDATIARVVAAAGELAAAGVTVRFVRSIFIPGDETCLLLIEADSAEQAAALTARAGLDPDRIALSETREP